MKSWGVSDMKDNYISVPPRRTFFVQTRYVFRGKGKPLFFDLDGSIVYPLSKVESPVVAWLVRAVLVGSVIVLLVLAALSWAS